VIDIAVFVVASVRATDTLVFVLGRECVERSVVGCVFDGGRVFAEGVVVDVVRARAGHQVAGYVVDGDHVVVVCGILVALVGELNESGGIGVEGELFGLCAFLCRLGSLWRDVTECYETDETFNYVELSVGRQDIVVSPHQLHNSLHFQSIHIQDIERCQ
jgi:hypothetical protein